MDLLTSWYQQLRSWHTKAWVQWLLAAIIFFLVSWLYMGSAINHCTSFTPAFNSDTSGGVVWFQWASGNHLSWGTTNKSNYPVGENLARPQFITSESFDIPYRILATLTSPICGINLMILLGYLSAALAMFGFIKWLFKRTALAYLAGYAVAYLPYHQLKSQSHVVYMFGALFVAIIWTFLWFVERPSYLRIALLSVLTALSFYFDGYFILLAAALVSTLLILYVLKILKEQALRAKGIKLIKRLLPTLKFLVIFATLLLVLVLPIAHVETADKAAIRQSLSASRGDIRIDAKVYGIRLYEFFLPSFNNPLLPTSYATWLLNHQHFSNTSEDTVYIGWTMIIAAGIALAMLRQKKFRELKLKPNLTYLALITMIGLTALVTIALSLQSKFTIFGVTVITPVDVVIHLTTFWRVFARFILVIDPLVVTLAIAGLFALTYKRSQKFYTIVLAISFVALFAEYLTFPPRAGADVYKATPNIYRVIANDPTVRVMAAYPLENLLYVPSVFTFQQVAGKTVINANDSSIAENPFHGAIAGLRDAQTLGVLKADKVGAIVVYGEDDSPIPGLVSYRPPDTSSHAIGLPTLYSYRIASTVAPRSAVLTAGNGFNPTTVDTHEISHHVLSGTGILEVDLVTTEKPTNGNYQTEFVVTPYAPNTKPTVTITQNMTPSWQGTISGPADVKLLVAGNQPLYIQTTEPIDLTNLQASLVTIHID